MKTLNVYDFIQTRLLDLGHVATEEEVISIMKVFQSLLREIHAQDQDDDDFECDLDCENCTLYD